MELYRHEDYNLYIGLQQKLTGRKTQRGKICLSFVDQVQIMAINDLIHSFVKEVKTIVCHGCRSGFEVDALHKLNPDAKVFGTDVYWKGYKYDREYFRPMDFDIVPPEWIGYFDVVYSNAIDHSRNPINTLTLWKSELSKDGIICVNYYWGRGIDKENCFNLDKHRYMEEIEEISKTIGMKTLYVSPTFTYARRRYFAEVIMGNMDEYC